MNKYCTIHQVVSEEGVPLIAGSEVRLPDGTVIPGVKRVDVVGESMDSTWRVTIELTAAFGEPIPAIGRRL